MIVPIIFPITWQCNLNCANCCAIKDKNIDIKKSLKAIATLPEEWVFITGGEPFLVDNLSDVCDQIRAMGKKVAVTTNGTIWRPDILDHIDRIGVSIDGPEVFHDAYRGEGVYKKAVDFLIYAVGKVETVLMTTVFENGTNIPQKCLAIAEDIGVTYYECQRDMFNKSIVLPDLHSSIVTIAKIPCYHDQATSVISGHISKTPHNFNEEASGGVINVDFVGVPTSGNAPLSVQFTDLSDPGQLSWSWDFGDTGTSSDQNPLHVYTSAGTYTVTLSVDYGFPLPITETKVDYITVTDPAYADFVGTPLTGIAALTVQFTDQSVGATSWSWDFGDGGSSTQQNPSHVYQSPGTYTVTLTINGSVSLTRTNYVTVEEITIDFVGVPVAGLAPLTVQFTDLSTGTPTGWYWDFGDGSTSREQHPLHVYQSPGKYTVTLLIGVPPYVE